MMIYGIGIDITEIARFRKMAEKQRLTLFAQKVLTPNEYEIFMGLTGIRALEFIAGRFSAKESYSKALGTGIGSAVTFQDLEILKNQATGQPIITKHPREEEMKAFISISHTQDVVMTEVILEL